MMNPHFEIKYLELKWYNKETLTKVTESLNSIPIEYDEKRELFQAETIIYPKLDGIERGQLAIRFFNMEASKPYIEIPNGKIKYLNPIEDPNTGITWWIFKEKWVSEQKQWFGIASNIVGTIRLVLQNKPCEIAINGSDFTRDQLEQYLRTFKNDLWEIILDENSTVQAEGRETKGIGVNDEVIECINSLVAHAEKVLKTPKVELREIQALKPRKAVKPVNRTFFELATKTNQRFLTSRTTDPSYNVAENRYVLFALERCHRIIKQIVILAENKAQRFQDIAEKLQNQHDAFTDTVKVNRDMVVADLQKIRERAKVEYWQRKIDKKLNDSNIELHSAPCSDDLYLKIENRTKEQDGFFVLIWDGRQWIKPENKSGILGFRYGFSELINVFERDMVLRINCDYIQRIGKQSVLFSFKRIHAIELRDSKAIQKAKEVFEKEKSIGISLAANGWVKSLSPQELYEQEKEKAALLNRMSFYNKNKMLSFYVYEKVEPKFRAIKKFLTQFKALNIKPSSYFPNSMTFVQNPHYQGLHNGYNMLRRITNLTDEELLFSLERIDEIGLVNMPLIYERWTLIRIILVLKDVFRFVPQDNWKYRLIDAIKTNQTDIKIDLSNVIAKRYITLWYEKTLPNNKRPDFVLDLTWFAQNNFNKREFKRFVIDAKFYDKNTFDKAGGMMSKVNELYIDKNYSENFENPVFLIHPCNNLIEHQVTSQVWGKFSFLGELNILDDGDFYSHNKGAIYLNPIDRALYSDELQRLLGMFIQYKLESSNTKHLRDDKTQAVPICIRCGSSHIKRLEKSQGYVNQSGDWVERTSRSVWMQCVECDQMQIYNHCASWDDNRTRLIKNGIYWSYHSARALEPFNMKCPSCGEWGAW
ncbi:MAG: hypothetical protein H7A00_16895 [Hahellaceae bacterium]|nr:hypothetical protein [Hahellaceae bacterium]